MLVLPVVKAVATPRELRLANANMIVLVGPLLLTQVETDVSQGVLRTSVSLATKLSPLRLGTVLFETRAEPEFSSNLRRGLPLEFFIHRLGIG